MNSNNIFIAIVFASCGYTNAQLSEFYRDKNDYILGLSENLYQTKIYNAAQYENAQQYFYNGSLSHSKKEVTQFFDNVIGVILQKKNAEKGLEAFIKEYPHSTYFAQANIPLADYYLAQKDFKKALVRLQNINQYQLSKEENTRYILKLGYAKFMTGDSTGAIEALEEAYQNIDESEKGDVAYMLGHLYYQEDGKSNKAFQYFDSIKNDDKYEQMVRPYYVQLYFNNKDYEKSISEGNEFLKSNLSSNYKAEIHKIIGESYFMLGEYEMAYPYLKNYLDLQNNPSERDLYEMGVVTSKMERYNEAVFYYNQLLNSDSPLAQNAYYQLGNAYLQTKKKQEALSAFRSAYQMNYDKKVQQLAHEQYAKLSYDIGNPFEAAPKVIQSYISKYPSESKNAELKSLLVKSYLYSGNYKETLEAIDKLSNSTSEINKIDQEVSFLLGTEQFNKENYNEAEKYFLRSLKLNENKEFIPRTLYWLAQTYYQKGNYPLAIMHYEKLFDETFPEKQQLNYDLGYAYFKSKNFDKAEEHFKKYLENPKPEFKDDAELRLADAYFANNDLNKAIAIYEKSKSSDDYTIFQKAMAHGFKEDAKTKISNLKDLISKYPSSEYVDDANYEIAVAYATLNDFATSNSYLDKVIKTSSDKDLIANAQIYKTQNLIDLNHEDQALSELKSLAKQYKNSIYVSKIVQAARPIYVKKGDISGYQHFALNVGVKIDASEIDEINLTAAKNAFAKKDYKTAIPYYEKYLSQNPTGEGLYQALYEMGESLYQTNSTTKALLVLQDVARVQNDYQEDAQTRIAQIYLAQKKKSDAKNYLEELSNSTNVSIRNFANVELMKICAYEKDFDKAEKYADAVIGNAKNSITVLESAKAIKARSLMNKGKDKDAQIAYANLEKSSNTEVAAEALYAKAYYQNKAKAFKSSNKTIFRLSNNYASEEYWGAKALVIMAKNYLALNDQYQASYTCDQIIANYSDFPDIVADAKAVKQQLNSHEKKLK